MAAPKRFYNGISDVSSDNPLGQFPYLDPTKWALYMEEFIVYDVAQSTTYWTLTQTNGVDSLVAGCGCVALTLGGSDNDLAQLYNTTASWATDTSKKMIFECRFKVDKGAGGTIGQQEIFIGLSSVQTGTNFFDAAGLVRTMDDAIGFLSYDGTTNIDCVQGEADVFSTEAGATTYADATEMVLSWYYDGSTTKFFKDDVEIAELTTNIATSAVTPMLYIKAGEAFASVLTVDYILVARER